jgi:hypothetical protein
MSDLKTSLIRGTDTEVNGVVLASNQKIDFDIPESDWLTLTAEEIFDKYIKVGILSIKSRVIFLNSI